MSNSTIGKVTKTINGVNKTFTYPVSDDYLYFKKVNDNLNVSEDGINFTEIGGGESSAVSLKLENWRSSRDKTVILNSGYGKASEMAYNVFPYAYHTNDSINDWIGTMLILKTGGSQLPITVAAGTDYVRLTFDNFVIQVNDDGFVFCVSASNPDANVSLILETSLKLTPSSEYSYYYINTIKFRGSSLGGPSASTQNVIVTYNSKETISCSISYADDYLKFFTNYPITDPILVDIVVIPSKEKGNILLHNMYYESEKKETVPYTIAVTDWNSLSDKSPFDHKLDIYFQPERTYDIVELINDNAVLFANYGFAIGEADSSKISIYSIGKPATSVTLTVIYTKEV